MWPNDYLTGNGVPLWDKCSQALRVSPIFGYNYQAYQSAWLIGVIFLAILFLNRIRPRFWCRILCPLGALLGIFSRFSVLKLEKYEDKCSQCKRCDRQCQGAASPRPSLTWETAECLVCFNCFNVCPEDALSFKFRLSPKGNTSPDIFGYSLLEESLTDTFELLNSDVLNL